MTRKVLIILAAVMISGNSFSQIPVTDVAAIANDTYNHVEQLVTAQQQLTNTLEQLGLSKKMLDGMNKAYERYDKVNDKIRTGRDVYSMLKMTYDMKDMYVDLVERITSDLDDITFNECLGHISNATGIINSTLRHLMIVEEYLSETFKMDDKDRKDELGKSSLQIRSNYLLLSQYYHKYLIDKYNQELQQQIEKDYEYFLNN